ncbi:unnamed protein product [Lampetra planeri]
MELCWTDETETGGGEERGRRKRRSRFEKGTQPTDGRMKHKQQQQSKERRRTRTTGGRRLQVEEEKMDKGEIDEISIRTHSEQQLCGSRLVVGAPVDGVSGPVAGGPEPVSVDGTRRWFRGVVSVLLEETCGFSAPRPPSSSSSRGCCCSSGSAAPQVFPSNIHIGGLFPSGSHEYEVFRFALAQHQDVPKLVPQVDMVETGSSFAMTYAFCSQFSKGVYAIMGLYDRRTVNMLMSFCGSLHVCFVTPSFPVQTNNQFVAAAAAGAAGAHHGASGTFLLDQIRLHVLAVLQRILDTAAEQSWHVTTVNLDTLTESSFIKLLAELDYKKEYQIIIDCELERLNYILNLVKGRRPVV